MGEQFIIQEENEDFTVTLLSVEKEGVIVRGETDFVRKIKIEEFGSKIEIK